MSRFIIGHLWSEFFFLCTFSASAADRPNVVFILADDMGYGDVGCYGAEKIKTPNYSETRGNGPNWYPELKPEPKPAEPPAQLYHLAEDLGETNSLYMQHREIVQRLKAGLERIKADESDQPTALDPPQALPSIRQLDGLFGVIPIDVEDAQERSQDLSAPSNAPPPIASSSQPEIIS